MTDLDTKLNTKLNTKLKPILERMREMQKLAEQFNAPISMSAADYKAVADHIESFEEARFSLRLLITAARDDRYSDEAIGNLFRLDMERWSLLAGT